LSEPLIGTSRFTPLNPSNNVLRSWVPGCVPYFVSPWAQLAWASSFHTCFLGMDIYGHQRIIYYLCHHVAGCQGSGNPPPSVIAVWGGQWGGRGLPPLENRRGPATSYLAVFPRIGSEYSALGPTKSNARDPKGQKAPNSLQNAVVSYRVCFTVQFQFRVLQATRRS